MGYSPSARNYVHGLHEHSKVACQEVTHIITVKYLRAYYHYFFIF